MTCEEATNLISARIDGEISPDDSRALEAHLASCAGCVATAEALAAQDGALERVFAPRRAAASALADRVIARLETEHTGGPPMPQPTPRERVVRVRSWMVPLLAAAAGFAIAVMIFRPWDRGGGGGTNVTQIPINRTATVTPVGTLSLATGRVFTCPQGSEDWKPLETGGTIPAGSKVKTAANVRCEFKMADGSEVRLNSQTEIRMASARNIEVASGQIFSTVQKANDAFVVKAAPAEVQLTALGTSFDVSCSSKSATVTVVEGSVKVEGKSENVLKSGETIAIASGTLGDKKNVQNLMLATQWVDEILIMKGRDNPELGRRIDDIFARLGHDKMWYMHASEVRRLGDHCVVPLTRYIQSEHSQKPDDASKRIEAARIISDVATVASIPELINLLADDDGEIRYHAARALQRLTGGQNQGRTPEQWRDQSWLTCEPTINQWHAWWDKNKTRFPGADPAAVKPVVAKKVMEIKGKG